jgi:hypothetical protein
MSTGSQEVLMQGLYAASSQSFRRSFRPASTRCSCSACSGVTISIAVILQLDMDGLSWILSNIE